ncbi:MAG TPA: MOSC domain-containing protein [Bacteroidota bacterium]|nr:MOSC domain-containing protein [Bacteroidota bacterium]
MLHTIDTRTEYATQQPKDLLGGTVISLQLCPGHRKPMQSRESVEALTALGLKGDIHAIEESTRQVLLIDQETLQELGLTPGQVKENITTAGIALAQLKQGQRLRIGTAVLQITKPCSPCSRMDEIRPGLQDELRGRRGILARVLQGGTIRVGDSIDMLT